MNKVHCVEVHASEILEKREIRRAKALWAVSLESGKRAENCLIGRNCPHAFFPNVFVIESLRSSTT